MRRELVVLEGMTMADTVQEVAEVEEVQTEAQEDQTDHLEKAATEREDRERAPAETLGTVMTEEVAIDKKRDLLPQMTSLPKNLLRSPSSKSSASRRNGLRCDLFTKATSCLID